MFIPSAELIKSTPLDVPQSIILFFLILLNLPVFLCFYLVQAEEEAPPHTQRERRDDGGMIASLPSHKCRHRRQAAQPQLRPQWVNGTLQQRCLDSELVGEGRGPPGRLRGHLGITTTLPGIRAIQVASCPEAPALAEVGARQEPLTTAEGAEKGKYKNGPPTHPVYKKEFERLSE